MMLVSFKIGFFSFLAPADLALICWLKVETYLNDLTWQTFLTGGTRIPAAILQL